MDASHELMCVNIERGKGDTTITHAKIMHDKMQVKAKATAASNNAQPEIMHVKIMHANQSNMLLATLMLKPKDL
eukprot:11191114-Lingulodinium_polyedra.AAC.1